MQPKSDAILQAFMDSFTFPLWLVDSNHNIFEEKGNKAAAGRARKAVGEIKKLVTEYRKASVSECK